MTQTKKTGPPMRIRDPDLRKVVWNEGIRPGDPLWRLLRELQDRRAEAQAASR